MALIVLTSAGHAPGVTATAVGLALNWPRQVLLCDLDRVPTQVVLAGCLGGVDPAHRGLGRLLQAHRERLPLEQAIPSSTVPLGERAAFLPGFSHPGVVGLFGSAWSDLAAALSSRPDDVVADAGRISPDGLPQPLASVADQVLVVTGTSLVDLVALRLYLPLLADQVGDGKLGVLLVGEGRPYRRSEVEQQFGVPIAGTIDWDPRGAEVYRDGAAPPRRFPESGYVRSLRRLAEHLTERVEEARRLVGVRR